MDLWPILISMARFARSKELGAVGQDARDLGKREAERICADDTDLNQLRG